MAMLPEFQSIVDEDIIQKYPIQQELLDSFRLHFRSKCDEQNVSYDSYNLGDKDLRILTSLLLSAIHLHLLSATKALRSNDNVTPLTNSLLDVISIIDSDESKIKFIRPLMNAVFNKLSDTVIWEQVYIVIINTTITGHSKLSSTQQINNQLQDQTIIDTINNRQRSTWKDSSDKLPFDTPVKSNSSSQRMEEQTHTDLDSRIRQEITGCLFEDVQNIYEKYFENKKWSVIAGQIAEKVDPKVVNGYWTDYPQLSTQKSVLELILNVQRKFVDGLEEQYGKYLMSPNHPLAGSKCLRKPDLFVSLAGALEDKEKYHWAYVDVIGELKQSKIPTKKMQEIDSFCGYAREVFAAQPTRRFLHGFIIRGSLMELWVFDRSGPYKSEEFNIHQNPYQFIKIIVGYLLMNDNELGINTYIKHDKDGQYIIVDGEQKLEEYLYLEDKPMAFQRAIVCRGTTCFRAKKKKSNQWEYVVKFAWRSDKRIAEGEYLRHAKKQNVWGIAKLFSHQDLETINDLRNGLQFKKLMRFKSTKKDSVKQNHSMSSGISKTSSTLYSRSSSSKRKEKESSENIFMQLPKRSKSISGSSNSINRKNIPIDNIMALDNFDNKAVENRIFSCLVISPPGRSIYNFISIKEYLEAFYDFIKAHRSLYFDGNILHRDISDNNIIIIEPKFEGDPKGMLIDLDLAKRLDDGPSGARHRTGTMQFMAIEILEGKSHTYRHDLESFFYVFLWVIIGYWEEKNWSLPKSSRLRTWYQGGYVEIADKKRAHMDKARLRTILAEEFPQRFIQLQGLVERLRDILFPSSWDGLFTGTNHDPDTLYKPMMEAFMNAIAQCNE